jgi:hypothetical protein
MQFHPTRKLLGNQAAEMRGCVRCTGRVVTVGEVLHVELVPSDPIAHLLLMLEHDGKPTLSWVVQWSAGGRDAVAAAWVQHHAAERPASLALRNRFMLLQICAPHLAQQVNRAWRALSQHTRGAYMRPPTQREKLPALLRAVPIPPTLSECIAAYARIRAAGARPPHVP